MKKREQICSRRMARLESEPESIFWILGVWSNILEMKFSFSDYLPTQSGAERDFCFELEEKLSSFFIVNFKI